VKGTVNSNGYLVVRRGGVTYYVHRLEAAAMLGRELRPGEQVHHRNGNRQDNRHRNLEIVTAREHALLHLRDRCKRGHEWTAENTYHRPDKGTRQCRACGRENNAERYERSKRAA
jgi:hypothetical protein